jgi:lactoylglutathione lyase
MKIEHVAIWAKDIDTVCEFYRKYFGGKVQPLYHNPAKQFTSRFVTFESGARLEVMHKPEIVGTATSLQSYTHRSANEKMRAFFRFLTSAVFHVKPYEPRVAEHTCMFYDRGDYGRPMAKPEAQQFPSEHLGYAHLSFSVSSKEDVDRLTQQMSEDGIQVVGQPRTTGDGYYESVVLDPEGNRIEITV